MLQKMTPKCTNKGLGTWIGLYEFGALDQAEKRIFLDHLIDCEYCYAQVYALEPIMAAFRNHRAAAKENPARGSQESQRVLLLSRRPRTWRQSAAFATLWVILVAAGLGLYIIVMKTNFGAQRPAPIAQLDDTAKRNPSPWEDIEIPKAAYTRPNEGITLRSPSTAFDTAMAAYQANDFDRAIEQLEPLSDVEPAMTPQVNFYWGVSLLKVGRSEEAMSALRRVISLGNRAQIEAAHYYLGLACLKADQPQQAIAELDAVVRINREHSAAAARLKRQVLERLK